MHVSLRHTRRVILGVAVGALFLTGLPKAGHAQAISICLTPNGQRILSENGSCTPPNRQVTWNPFGVIGPTGPQGPQGQQGPAGPTGAMGEMGPQGPLGPAGAIGPGGDMGATGPVGLAGEVGQQGPQGPTGATGATGPSGPTGPSGVNGIQYFLLSGGDLGSNIQLLTSGATTLSGGNSPIFYGPGNGSDTILNSVAVPIDTSTVTQLYVQTANVPGSAPAEGQTYTFTLCRNNDCNTSVSCGISLPNLTTCSDLSDTVSFLPGDTIALRADASSGAAPTEVTWSVVLQQSASPAQ